MAEQTKALFDDLKALILDHAERGAAFERPRKIRSALDSNHDPRWEEEWFEASILFNCHCRTKPARTHGALARLRQMRIERNERAQFDEFMKKVTDLLYPEFITPHGYNSTFSKLDSRDIFCSMGRAVAPLAAFGCPLFLFAGALLGYERGGELIDHDDDIDVGIFLGECTGDEVSSRWASYKRKLTEAGLLSQEEVRANNPSLKLKTDLPIHVDLFPAWVTEGRFSVYPYSFGELPENVLFPLKSFGQDPLKLPANPPLLLAQSYGDDWRTPDPLFRLNWPKKKKLFHSLVQYGYAM